MIPSSAPERDKKRSRYLLAILAFAGVLLLSAIPAVVAFLATREPESKFEDCIIASLSKRPKTYGEFRVLVENGCDLSEGERWYLKAPANATRDNAVASLRGTIAFDLGSPLVWIEPYSEKDVHAYYRISLDGGGGGWGGGDPRGSFEIFLGEDDVIVAWWASKPQWRERILAGAPRSP